MKTDQTLLEKYYKGETTIEEERSLKEAWDRGELANEPALAFSRHIPPLPAELGRQIRSEISRRQSLQRRQRILAIGSIAAVLVLLISLRGLMPRQTEKNWQLSDNLKKERFEDALRTIGNVLEERTLPEQKVLYEDHNLIIAVE